METLDVENFFLEKENTYNSHQAYKNSKLANAMFTYELAKQLENTGVTVNCLCPGMPSVFHTLLISSIHNPMISFPLSPLLSPLHSHDSLLPLCGAYVHFTS